MNNTNQPTEDGDMRERATTVRCDIANRYGIAVTTLNDVLQRRTWRHINTGE